MTAQKKFNPQQQAEYFFKQEFCRTKVWVALENGITKTFYANDCNATWLQLACGHVKEVTFDYLTGIEYVLAKEKFFNGKYTVMEVYRRGLEDEWPEEPVIKFVKGKKPKINTDELPPNVRFKVERFPKPNFVGYGVKLHAITGTPQPSAPVLTDIPEKIAAQNLKEIGSRVSAIRSNWSATR